jgi:hypothetical protein
MGTNKVTLPEILNSIFKANKLEWKRSDGTMFTPTTGDFAGALDKVKSVLYGEEDGTQMEFGRLIVKKDEGHIDVYCRIGEIE